MKRVILFTMLLAVVALSAAFVPLEKAKKVAENYYGHYCSEVASKGSSVINVQENKYEGLITRYTFEFDKGFVIVTADDELYPILGYSDHGKVPKAGQNGGQNFKEWFDNYDRQIACKGSGKYVDEAAVKLWKDIENNIFPAGKAEIVVDRLVKSQWGQLFPWNIRCPEKDSMETYVGCVATAMAQILRYHRWPDVGVGSASYEWNGQTLSADFTSHTWNYDLMPEVPDIEFGLYPEYWETGITQAEKDELAIQSYWTGLSVDMSYGTLEDNGSWAYAAPVDDAFLEHWKASSSVYYTMDTPPTAGVDAQFATIKAELDAKRPWFWAGGVHAFVLDGYRDDYWYHFNWGWEGNYDGWFHRSGLVPGGVGSCDTGGGDFTAGQLGITYVPSNDPYELWPPTEISGSVVNVDDIVLSWVPNYSAVGYKLFRTKDNHGVPELIADTSGFEYTDSDLPEGDYSYHVVTVYLDGESHNSNSFSVEIAAEAGYPTVLDINADFVGRASIDLTWTAPFVGILNTYENFESGVWPTGWVKNTTADGTPVWTGDPEGFMFFTNGYPTWYYADRIEGWFVGKSSTATQTGWILSPSYTLNSAHYIKWWTRFRYSNDGEEGIPNGSNPKYEVVTYAGTFSEAKRESDVVYTVHASYDNTDPENIWVFEETCAINITGVARVGFRCPVTTGTYSLGFDKITIGSADGGGENPNGYQIYRGDGTLATVTDGAATGWSDTNYVDGVNEYYIRVLYPTGLSLPCERVSVTVDKNPKPDFLTVDYQYFKADLSWYMPYHNPPKWYTYFDPHYANAVTTLNDPISPIDQKRTVFTAADLGYIYPITLDSIAAIFYDENEADWGGENQFVFRVFSGYKNYTDTVISVYHTSPALTAVHGQLVKYSLPFPLVLTEDFNIEIINLSGNDNPTNLMALVDQSHSFDRGTDGSYFWSIVSDDIHYEWSFWGYITSSEPPPIDKNDRIARKAYTPPETKTKEILNPREISVPFSGKALDYYKIYRNGIAIGTSTTLNYSDESIPLGLEYLAYKVTAVYADPPGESDPSNEVVVFGTGIENNEIIPHKAELFQNYPNPFNPATTIRYSLPAEADVKLTVFDISGREVAGLVSGRQGKGNHSVNFNAEDLTSGMYIYSLKVDGKTVQTRKMMLLK